MHRKVVKTRKNTFDPQDFLAGVADGQSITKYTDRQSIFAQGDPAELLFYIHKGKVKVTVLSRKERRQSFAILGNGQFFGEGCLAGQTHRTASVTALSECTIARLEKAGGGPGPS